MKTKLVQSTSNTLHRTTPNRTFVWHLIHPSEVCGVHVKSQVHDSSNTQGTFVLAIKSKQKYVRVHVKTVNSEAAIEPQTRCYIGHRSRVKHLKPHEYTKRIGKPCYRVSHNKSPTHTDTNPQFQGEQTTSVKTFTR
ncbi:unnamed protein product [Meganyctiphanes norvegica]|uniref:Uncharacterized protein n=1 Tax=Meganyctiphanes norvegica TaxID=48144 RepID=A0AAV2SNU0_MEGNR